MVIHSFILRATDVIQGINHEFHSREEGDFSGDGHSFIHSFILRATDVIQGINHEFHGREEGDFSADGHSFIHSFIHSFMHLACNRCNPRN
jgi:hypothetical protein